MSDAMPQVIDAWEPGWDSAGWEEADLARPPPTDARRYISRAAVWQVMIEVAAGSVPQETIDLCRAEGVDPHDALQMGYACACFKLKGLLDKLDAPLPASDDRQPGLTDRKDEL